MALGHTPRSKPLLLRNLPSVDITPSFAQTIPRLGCMYLHRIPGYSFLHRPCINHIYQTDPVIFGHRLQIAEAVILLLCQPSVTCSSIPPIFTINCRAPSGTPSISCLPVLREVNSHLY